MAIIRVTKQFTFEMAHALHNYDGPCKNIHGHSYHLEVTIKGPVDQEGFVMDFSHLKKIVHTSVVAPLDHALVLEEATIQAIPEIGRLPMKIKVLPVRPSCENLLCWVVDQIAPQLPITVSLEKVFLRETPQSYAEWLAEDNRVA